MKYGRGYTKNDDSVVGSSARLNKIILAERIARTYGMNPLDVLNENNGNLYEMYLIGMRADRITGKKFMDKKDLERLIANG